MSKPFVKWAWALVPAMLMPFIGSLLYWVILGDAAVASRVVYSSIKVFALFWPILAWIYLLRRQIPWTSLKDWRAHVRALPLGILTGLVISAGIVGFRYLPGISEAAEAGAGGIVEKTTQLGVLNHYWAFAVFISVFHSLLEEYYWRGFVCGLLTERLPRLVAILLAAAAFSSHHFVILWAFFDGWLAFLTGMGVFFGGVIWAIQFQRQKSLAGVWISHCLVDFTILAIGWDLLTRFQS